MHAWIGWPCVTEKSPRVMYLSYLSASLHGNNGNPGFSGYPLNTVELSEMKLFWRDTSKNSWKNSYTSSKKPVSLIARPEWWSSSYYFKINMSNQVTRFRNKQPIFDPHDHFETKRPVFDLPESHVLTDTKSPLFSSFLFGFWSFYVSPFYLFKLFIISSQPATSIEPEHFTCGLRLAVSTRHRSSVNALLEPYGFYNQNYFWFPDAMY